MEPLNDETMIWSGHPTWRSMLSFHIQGFLIVVLAVVVLWSLRWAGVGIGTVAIVLVAVAGVAITVLAGWTQRFFTEYTITTKRLHIRRGILAKTESSTNVDRVQNITIRQSLVDRILRAGTLEFDTAGDEESDRLRFRGVNSPQQLSERIMHAQDDERSRGGHDSQGGLA